MALDSEVFKMDSNYSVEPVLLIKNFVHVDEEEDCKEEMIIPDKSIEGENYFDNSQITTIDAFCKTPEQEKAPDKSEYSLNQQYRVQRCHIDNGDLNNDVKNRDEKDDEVIILCISDGEGDDENRPEVQNTKDSNLTAGNCDPLKDFKEEDKVKVGTDDCVICISDDEEKPVVVKPKPRKKFVSRVSWVTILKKESELRASLDAQQQAQFQTPVSSIKPESPVTSVQPVVSSLKPEQPRITVKKSLGVNINENDDNDVGDDEEEEVSNDNTNDWLRFLLNDQSSGSDNDEKGFEIEDDLNDADYIDDSFTETKVGGSHCYNGLNDHDHNKEHSGTLRRTSRKRTVLKTKCPCCVNSSSFDSVPRRKESCDDKIKKRKISEGVSLMIKNKKNISRGKLVTDITAEMDEEKKAKYYSCPVCEFKTILKDELTGHWRKLHAIPITSINEIYSFLKAIKDNKECETCLKMVSEHNNINAHILWHSKLGEVIDDCVLCSMLYTKLKTHVFNHTPYKCQLCMKSFTNVIDLKKHLITHLYDEKFNIEDGGGDTVKRCTLCTRTFNSIYDNILEHLEMHHSNFNFITTDDLLKHKVEMSVGGVNQYKMKMLSKMTIDTNSNDLTYFCSCCSSKYTVLHSFVRHLKTSHNNFQRKCKRCNEQFESCKDLQAHINMKHFDVTERFRCPACNKTFVNVMSFRIHFKIHGENDMSHYNCPICLNVLSNMYSLKRHLLIHTGEKPFQCTKCELKFRDKRNLDMHMKSVHADNHSLLCNLCNKAFSCKEYLRKHMRNFHCKFV